MKTNATRYLDTLEIRYELRDYLVDPDDLGAIKVANQIGLPPSQVFKTLLAKGDGADLVMAVVPGDQELDLKALARLSGHRRVELVPVSQLQPLTGYIRGGVTALACKKRYPVYLDESAASHMMIAVSAGVRGTQIVLAPQDYARAVAATLSALVRPPGSEGPPQPGQADPRPDPAAGRVPTGNSGPSRT
jgi:Cys-tRNA(Pro)/Cys-tRNA(Cys) deacylase